MKSRSNFLNREDRGPRCLWLLPVALVCLIGWTTPALAQRGDREEQQDRGDRGDRGQRRGRGSWDPAEFLQRLDRNGNGTLEPEEMEGRTARFVQGMGMDPTQSIKIDRLVSRIRDERENRSSREDQERARESRKVPGFGIDATEARQTVSNFSASTSTGGQSASTAQFSDEIMARVDGVLERYDENRNGQLERNEFGDARWGNPTPEESDTNRDGVLSRTELAQRYLARERDRNRQRNEAGDSSRDRGRDSEQSGRGFRSSSRPTSMGSRSNDRGSSDRGSSRGSTRSSASSSSSSDRGGDRYLQYAQGLIDRYDKNGDGKLDAQETKEMRRPPENADLNKDGFITREEYADVLSGRSRGSEGSSDSNEGDSRNAGERESRRRGADGEESPRSRRSVSFRDNDTNGDGQLQMSEYAEEWDAETVAEFQRRDLNNDGVITEAEWGKTR